MSLTHRTLMLLLVSALLACEPKQEATPLTAVGLAAALSGGRTDPVCRNRGPRGEYLGPVPGAEHCQWPTVTRGAEFSTVTATRDSILGWTSLTYERVFSDTARVRVALDSLDDAFTAQGLVAHRCVGGGLRWYSPSLVVQTMPAMPRPAGGHVMMLYASGLPAAIPSLFCPDAPPVTTPRDPSARTS